MADFMASQSVLRGAGKLPRGPTATFPPASGVAPQVPRRGGAAPAPAGTGANTFDPNRHHVSMTENDQQMLGVLPRRMDKQPNRSQSKG